ncbi:MAG: Ppx/GppA phosphatase family protein [Bauldia sp.]
MGDGLQRAGQYTPDLGHAEARAAAAPPSVTADRTAGGQSGTGHRPHAADSRRPSAAKARGSGQRLYAALDLGTNNCRLLIATPRDRGFRVVDSFSRIVRLGEGISGSGRLADAAMDRAIQALKVCKAKLAARDVRRFRLIATEACRLASNGPAFLERVRAETGLELEIVSRETEARLAVAGCASLVDPDASGAILFDIGGGSSELVWLDLVQRDGEPRRRISERVRSWQSLPIGVVTLSERHGGQEVSRDTYEAMVLEVSALLAKFPQIEKLDEAAAAGGVHLLGTSGTVTTLAGVHLGLDRYDRRQVDGLWMTSDEVDATIRQLRDTDFAGRIANPCIGRERADLVLAGCAILEAVRRRWRCERLRVADRGLREGILVEMMTADGVWRRRRPDAAERTVGADG